MRSGLEGAILAALILGSTGGRAFGAAGPREEPAAVTLNPEHTVVFFPIDRAILAGPPPMLRVSVTRVVNPVRTPVGISVYLSPFAKGSEEILIGDVALFPPDHAGSFLLGTSKAFAESRAQGSSEALRLKIELRRLHPAKPWTSLEVTVAPPRWVRE